MKAASKTKYSCPGCGLNAWAKPETTLYCGECYDGDDGELLPLVNGEAAEEFTWRRARRALRG